MKKTQGSVKCKYCQTEILTPIFIFPKKIEFNIPSMGLTCPKCKEVVPYSIDEIQWEDG